MHAISPRKKSPLDANGNGLCRKCNINQELKVQQLAVFMPINPAHYDEEVDEYRCVTCPYGVLDKANCNIGFKCHVQYMDCSVLKYKNVPYFCAVWSTHYCIQFVF